MKQLYYFIRPSAVNWNLLLAVPLKFGSKHLFANRGAYSSHSSVKMLFPPVPLKFGCKLVFESRGAPYSKHRSVNMLFLAVPLKFGCKHLFENRRANSKHSSVNMEFLVFNHQNDIAKFPWLRKVLLFTVVTSYTCHWESHFNSRKIQQLGTNKVYVANE